MLRIDGTTLARLLLPAMIKEGQRQGFDVMDPASGGVVVITIAGVKVASPADVKIGRFDLTKSNRTASGKMAMEIIRAGVRRVDVSWSYLPDDQLEADPGCPSSE